MKSEHRTKASPQHLRKDQETSAMKHKRLFALPMVVFAVLILALFAAARADEDNDKLGPYKLIATITPTGFGTGFDISWVDSEAGRYYLANRATPPPSHAFEPTST